jgi:hypothetical protein
MHTFEIGESVWIINQTISGKFIIEGKVTISEQIADVYETYIVTFPASDGFSVHAQRFVDPAAQDNPRAFIEQLNASRQ